MSTEAIIGLVASIVIGWWLGSMAYITVQANNRTKKRKRKADEFKKQLARCTTVEELVQLHKPWLDPDW